MAGIPDGDSHTVAAFGDADGHYAFSFTGLNAVDDCILYQRLNKQAGNVAVHLFINIINDGQLVAKTSLLNGDVVLDLIQFLFDVNLLIIF